MYKDIQTQDKKRERAHLKNLFLSENKLKDTLKDIILSSRSLGTVYINTK